MFEFPTVHDCSEFFSVSRPFSFSILRCSECEAAIALHYPRYIEREKYATTECNELEKWIECFITLT